MIPHEWIILAKEQSGHSYIFWVSYFLIYAYFNILAQSQILGNSLYLFEKRIILSEKKPFSLFSYHFETSKKKIEDIWYLVFGL